MENDWPASTPPTLPPRYLSVPQSQATISDLESPILEEQEGYTNNDNIINYQTQDSNNKVSTCRILTMDRSAASTLASGTARVGLSPEALAAVKREKDWIKFRVPSLELFPSQNTILWGQVLHVDWTEFEDMRQKIPSLRLDVNKGLAKMMQLFQETATPTDAEKDYKVMSRRLVICPICFKDPTVSLLTSVVMLGKGLTSNISQHRRLVHPRRVFPTSKGSGGVGGAISSSKSVTSSSQSSISRFVHNQPLNREQATSAVKNAIYQCVNDCGFPSHTVEKAIFRQLLNTVRENAQFLKSTDLHISTRALETMRINSYSSFIDLVKDLGASVRSEYELLCGKTIPFATVCHDIWQGKKKDILGVSLMFADPRNCKMYQIPIGLVQTKGHSALQVSEVTLNLMSSFGFSQADLSASVNDNTNSAVLAGKYILGTKAGGKCDMHKAELVVKHATGIAERTEAKKVVDTNIPFRALYKKFHKFSSWLMSKRCPARWSNFKNFCLHNNSVVVEIALPGDTRVAGVQIMFQSLIRIKWQMDDYASRTFAAGDTHAEFKAQYPGQDEWVLLSEFEGILAPLQKFAMTLQSEEPGANSASLMEAYTMRHQVAKMRTGTVSIISLEATDYDIQSTWDGSVPLATLDKKRIEKKFEDLHDASRLLINRLFKEYQTYFMDSVDKSGEFGICSNPLLVDIVPKFFFFLSAFKATDTERMYKSFISDMTEKHWVPMKSKATPNTVLETAATSSTIKPTSNTDPLKRKTNDIFAAFLASEKSGENSTTVNHDSDALTEEDQKALLYKECEEGFHYYVNHCKAQILDWESIIESYPTKKYTNDSKSWTKEQRAIFQEYCVMKNYCMIGKYFNVMAWWHHHGPRFPKVFPSAIVALSQPATNAFQERVFSLASWFDSNRLMNRQFPKNFEMRTMEAVTRKMRHDIVTNESLLSEEAKLERKKKGTSATFEKPTPREGMGCVTSTTRQLMNMTTYIHRFNTTGTLSENRNTDPGKSVTMPFVARFKDIAASAAQLARVSCVPSPNEPSPCGDVTDFGQTTILLDVDDEDELGKDVAPAPDITEKGFSHADGVQILSLQYDSDINDDDTDDECEFDSDKTLLENLQQILEKNDTVTIDNEKDSFVEASPIRKSTEPLMASMQSGDTIEGASTSVEVNNTGFLAWMNNPTMFGVPCDDTEESTDTRTTSTGTGGKRNAKDGPGTGKSPKRPKKQAMLPQRKSPSRAAKTKNDVARDRLSGEPVKKKTEEEMEVERIRRRKTLHKSQTAEMKKKVEEREKKENEAIEEAMKQSLTE